jgi:hypothetical protein
MRRPEYPGNRAPDWRPPRYDQIRTLPPQPLILTPQREMFQRVLDGQRHAATALRFFQEIERACAGGLHGIGDGAVPGDRDRPRPGGSASACGAGRSYCRQLHHQTGASARLGLDEVAKWRECHCRYSEAARLLPGPTAPTWPKQGAGVRISRNPAMPRGRAQVSPSCGSQRCGSTAGYGRSVRTALYRRLRSGPPRENRKNPQRLDRANRGGFATTDELLCTMKMDKGCRNDGH